MQGLKKYEKLDSRTYAVVGSNEALFGVIEALRKIFVGKIVVVPFKRSGIIENKSVLC